MNSKEAYYCLTAYRAGHSNIMCMSSATAAPPQCVHTLYNMLVAPSQEQDDRQIYIDDDK